jgi:thymidine kinase
VDVVGIDEAQFFDKHLVDVVVKLANQGTRVIVAGLDMDFKGNPFGPIPGLMAVADFVTKVHAVCMRCGSVAQFSHRMSEKEQVVLLGEKDIYEPLCRRCYLQENTRQ